MSYPERHKIRSIPPRTMSGVRVEKVGEKVGKPFSSPRISPGIGRLGASVPWQSRSAENDSFDVPPYVPQKPDRRKPRETLILPKSKRITCEIEQMDDYNGEGDLGIILQFAGIEFTKTFFLRSRHNSPDSPVFYIPIDYNKKAAAYSLLPQGIFSKHKLSRLKKMSTPFSKRNYTFLN